MKRKIFICVSLLCAMMLMLMGCGAETATTDGTSSAQTLTEPPQGSFELCSPDGQVQFTAADLACATAYDGSVDNDSLGYVIKLTFTDEAAERLAAYTRAHIGETLALVVDGQELSAPMITTEITGGEVVVGGDFDSLEDVQEIVDAIYGTTSSAGA